jgi:hypothetical protein
VWTNGEFAFTGQYADIRQPQIYTDFLTRPEDFQRFRIQVRAASTTRTFTIDAFNITEGSETVRIDGRTLVRNRDYTIDYETGEVELIGDAVLDLTPNSNITIDYEFKPFVGGGASSLVGFNSLLNWSTNSKFGTTWLYESKSSASDRPRLGEEPSRIIVGELNGTMQFKPRIFTWLVNLLPRVSTDATSSLNLSGEVAVSMPNPNTKKEVYIDDFEGVEDSDVFGLTRRSWYPASPPISDDGVSPRPSANNTKVFWYNIEPDLGVHRRDLNPNLDERESTLVPSLDMEFESIVSDPADWAGVMTGFRGAGLDLSQGQFIEIWVNDFKPDSLDRGGMLHVDMGFIDEDFYQPDDNDLNTEDANFDGFSAITEDTGLDNIFNDDPELGPGDPGDDYTPSRIAGRFSEINGTERNGLLDTEDLDGSGQLDKSNGYFTYELDLSQTAIIDVRRDFPLFADFNHPKESWRLYRIDLADYKLVNTNTTPVFEQIKHLRVWMDSIPVVVDSTVNRFQIVGFKVVGNRWELDGVRALNDSLRPPGVSDETTINLGVISTKTDAEYIPPVLPNKENDIFEKEQSLHVRYDSLEAGDAFRIRKRFAGRGLDWTNYRDIKFWVHTDKYDANLEYFFRVGFDSLNYYEVNVPLRPDMFDTATNWSRVMLDLTELTDLKFLPVDSVRAGTGVDKADPTRVYDVRLVGNPSLFNVRFFYAGLRNKGTTRQSGHLWLNDIFLGDVKRDVDYAQRFSASVNMGNVININASYRKTGPDFRGLRARRGSGSEDEGIALNAKTNVSHFIPTLGFQIPVSGNYTRNVSLPKFTPNSDTEITERTRQDSLRTESIVRGFSSTLTRSGSKNVLFRYTFDKLKLNFAMSEAMRRSPASIDTTLNMTATLDYAVTWGQGERIPLFKGISLRYWPNSLNFRVNATRRTGQRYRLVGGEFVADPSTFNASLNNSGSISYIPFPSLTTSFRADQQRDPKLQQDWIGVGVGREIGRSHSFQANYKPPPVFLIGAFSPDINYSSSYREDSSPNVRRVGDPIGARNVSNNRDLSVRLRFDLGKYMGKVLGAVGLADKDQQPTPPGRPPQTGGTGGQAQPDTTEVKKAPPNPLTIVRGVGNMFANIRRINASVRQRVQSNYSRIPTRPTLDYQFGLTNKTGIFVFGEEIDEPERTNESIAISLDSGTNITKNLDVAARFTTTITNSGFRNSETRAVTTSWPDLNFSWKGLEKFRGFAGIFVATTANMGFRKNTRESGRRGEDPETINESTQLNPAIAFTWKNGLASTVAVSRTNNSTDTRGSISENSSLNVSVDLKYTFQPGKIGLPLPFLRGKNLASRLDTSVNMGYTKSSGRRKTAGAVDFDDLPGTSQISVNPRLTYNFTRALNGSFFIDYTRQFSDATNQTTTTVRVGLNAIFTF